MQMIFSSAQLSDRGPRQVNEDSIDCWRSASGQVVASVADGLGGMGDGGIASALASRALRSYLNENGVTQKTMVRGFLAAHSAITDAQTGAASSRMATTLTCIAVSERQLIGAHCGDSRAVIARGKGIKKLTTDHTEGQRLYDAGKLTKNEFATYQRRHILESALGAHAPPQIDSLYFELLPGDRLMLLTDGVHNIISLKELQSICEQSSTPSDLVGLAFSKIKEKGPTDNFSIVTIFAE